MSAPAALISAPSTTASEAPSFEALAETHRLSLFKCAYRLCGNKEIAARLGLTSAGAGTRLFRARQKLREALGERG
jgi:DNA-directed RNA polymerase specialized sigma24 family protein